MKLKSPVGPLRAKLIAALLIIVTLTAGSLALWPAIGAADSTCAAHQWLRAFGYPSAATCSQPSFADLSSNVPANTLLGNSTGSTGPIVSIGLGAEFGFSGGLLRGNVFTTSAKGLVPAPGSAAGNFLRDDGTWVAVPDVLAADNTWTGLNTYTQSPVIPTPTQGDASTKAADTAFVDRAVKRMVLFAIGGQSNAQGASGDPRLTPTMPAGRVYQWYGSAFTPITSDPVGNAQATSAWPAAAVQYLSAHPNDYIGFVPSAVGGTNQCSTTGGAVQNWDTTGTLAPALVANVTAAYSAAQAAGFSPTYAGLFWSQGENEAGAVNVNPPSLSQTSVTGGPYSAGTTAITIASATNISTNNVANITLDDGSILSSQFSITGLAVTLFTAVPVGRQILTSARFHIFNPADYELCFRNMLAYYRSTTTAGTTWPTLPVYVSLLGAPNTGTNAGYDAIREAQKRVIQSDSYTKLGFADAVSFAARHMMQENCGFTGSIASTTLIVTAIDQTCTTPLIAGSVITGSGVGAGTTVTALGTNTFGGVGTYTVSVLQTVASEAMQATLSPLHYLAEGYNEMGRALGHAASGSLGTAPRPSAYNVHRITLGGTITAGDTWLVIITQRNMSTSPWALGPVTFTGSGTVFCPFIRLMEGNGMSPSAAVLTASGITAKAFCPSTGAAYLEVYQPATLSPQATVTSSLSGGATESVLVTKGVAEPANWSGSAVLNTGNLTVGGTGQPGPDLFNAVGPTSGGLTVGSTNNTFVAGAINSAVAGTDNIVLRLGNTYPADASDQRVSLIFQPNMNSFNPTDHINDICGTALEAAHSNAGSGEADLRVVGYNCQPGPASKSTWATFFHTGGVAIGSATDPLASNLLVAGSIKSGPGGGPMLTGPGGTLTALAYSGSGADLTANTVSNAKLSTMTNATIKCRNTAGTGSPEDCTTAQVSTLLGLGGYATISAGVITASLGSDVALDDIAAYRTGPSVAQGSTGTWCASGTVSVQDTAGAATVYALLWDGTNNISSAILKMSAANEPGSISLSGCRASPAGNLRISVKDITSTSGAILFNATGTSKDSTVTAWRVN